MDYRILRIAFVAVLVNFAPVAYAQHAGMNVTKSGQIDQDVYTAGGTVQMLAQVDGDVVVAGGNLTIVESVSGDILAAGGTITISADVGDDIRAVGGTVSLAGRVAGDAVVAGGSVALGPSGTVAGRAWLAGGSIAVDGDVGEELKAAGGEVVISSTIEGDVEIYAESLIVEPGAVILGNLDYTSPRQAVIGEGARIDGEINWREFELEHEYADMGWDFGAHALFFLSLAVSSIALCVVFPRFATGSVQRLGDGALKSFGLGILVLVATPIAVVMLMASVLGIPLAFVVLALYFAALVAGFLVTLAWVGDVGFRRIGWNPREKRLTRVFSIIAGAALLLLLGLVPFVGGLLLFIAWLLGIGALALYMHQVHCSAKSG